MNVGLALLCFYVFLFMFSFVFMDLDCIPIHKLAKTNEVNSTHPF